MQTEMSGRLSSPDALLTAAISPWGSVGGVGMEDFGERSRGCNKGRQPGIL